MNEFTWAENELMQLLDADLASGRITVIHEVEAILSALDSTFPFPDNRLNWGALHDVVVAGGPGTPDRSSAFTCFLRDIAMRENLQGNVVVVGDNQINFVISGSLDAVLDVLPLVTEFPQHTYVYPFPEVSWCASMTFEGDFYFSFAPARNSSAR